MRPQQELIGTALRGCSKLASQADRLMSLYCRL